MFVRPASSSSIYDEWPPEAEPEDEDREAQPPSEDPADPSSCPSEPPSWWAIHRRLPYPLWLDQEMYYERT